jgi:peptidyl-dipeptidase A
MSDEALPVSDRGPEVPGLVSQTTDEASSFADAADVGLRAVGTRAERARWVYATHITEDTAQIATEAVADHLALTANLALDSVRFDGLALPDDVRRRLDLLKLALPAMAPDRAANDELSSLGTWLEGAYGKGRHAPIGREPLSLDDLSRILAHSRDPDELLDAWTGWHAVGRAMREPYRRFVEISNDGAAALGFADNGERWRSGYDMSPRAFEADVERIWTQVRGLYESLHAYVRRRLCDAYGERAVPRDGPIPAHLLGDMWAQEWGNIAALVVPEADAGGAPDLTALLESQAYDPLRMVRTGEAFFTSLGFDPLPDTFWERSMFTRPADREVVCHASAWTIDEGLDLRLKMCIEVTGQDFQTIHHELGHTFYQRAYRRQPYLFHGGANDGFHEAIGDAISQSVTSDYLVRIGLLDEARVLDNDIAILLREGLDMIPRLPWELAVEKWRWEVFSGETGPDAWNERWWELRRRYQGIAPPVPRTEHDFDPGAKYHIPANVPYIRYFLATLLQFQFHKALTETAGADGPLHRRSIYGSRAAGDRLASMLEMGRSRPWPDAMEVVAGTRTVDATAFLEYFAPLQRWLDEQNEGVPVGW